MIVSTLISMMNALACRRVLVTMVSVSATTISGSVPMKYLLQNIARRSSGLDFSSQSSRPSSEMAGKMKNVALA